MENGPFIGDLTIPIVIFHSNGSLPKGIHHTKWEDVGSITFQQTRCPLYHVLSTPSGWCAIDEGKHVSLQLILATET